MATPPAARPRSAGDAAAATINPPNLRTPAPPSTTPATTTPPPAAITPTKAMMTPPTKKTPAPNQAQQPNLRSSLRPHPRRPWSRLPRRRRFPSLCRRSPFANRLAAIFTGMIPTDSRCSRPPGWEIIEDARTTLPGAIAALGTNDQTTYLLIGASPSAGSLDADLKASDVKLKEMVENFRPLGDKKSTVAGLPAIERRFRGAVDGKDWSGTVVLVQRGKQLYTIFGMTYAGTDLVQIQENVIHRAITSLQFTK